MIPAVRRELKYLVPREQVDAIRDALGGFCVLDEHSAAQPDRRYLVDSLYLDGPGLPFYRAKIDRAKRRLKLRVRTYGDFERGFLEVKRKDDEAVHKTRARFVGRWRDAVVAPESRAADDFAAAAALSAAEPTVWVRYKREAWAGVLEDYARVTFDSHLQFQPADAERPIAGSWRTLDDPFTARSPGSFVVMELKFERAAPIWMAALVRRFELFRRGYSKYCAGVDQTWGRFRPTEPMSRVPTLG